MLDKNNPVIKFIFNHKSAIIVCIIALVVILLMMSSQGKDFTAFKKLAYKQRLMMEKEYEARIAGLEKTISALNKELTDSQRRNSILKIKINDKQKKMEAVRPPEGMDEIQRRFIALGYKPVLCR